MPIVVYRLLVLGVTTLVVVAPLSLVVYQSFLTAPFFDPSAKVGLLAYSFVLADPDFWQAFWTTIAIAGGMAAIAVPLGALLAFLMVRTDVPGRQYLEPLILIPIFVSAVVIAFGYVVAIGPVGIFSTLAKDIFGFVPWNLYSLLALIIIAGLTHVPHVYLYSAAALRGLSTDLEEAARVSGANPFRVAVNVSLPMILPAILFAGVLVFFLGFELFGLPLVLGDPQDLLVLSTYLFKLTNKLGVPSYQLMAVVVVAIIAITAPLVFMQRMLLRQAQRYVSVRGKGLKTQPLPLHGWRWVAFAGIVLWLFVTVVVPISGITLRSFVVTWGEGVKLLDVLTLDHYRELTDYPNVVRGIFNTLGIGVIGGACSRCLLHGNRACGAPVELRLDAACRLPGDGAARDAGPRRRPCPAVGIPVRAVPLAAQVDDGLDLARLLHCLARLRHAACLRHFAAGRAGAGGSRAHSRRKRPARQARRHRAADQIRHAGKLAAGLPDFCARILDRHLPAWSGHRGHRFASGVALGDRCS